MTPDLPDAIAAAQAEAQQINADRWRYLVLPIVRVLADAKHLERRELFCGLTEFHLQRMSKIPSPAKYPEAEPWVDYALTVDREVQRLADLTDEDMAVLRSFRLFCTFRGFKQAVGPFRPSPARDEKCRVAYLPETDRGEMIIKNVDNVLNGWKPRPRPDHLAALRASPLRFEGTGSSLHLDDEPEELFPLPVRKMMTHYTSDVPGAVEFLTRYCPFWGRANLLIHDQQQRSVAIEKCSFKYIDVYHPGPDGRSHISGSTCRGAGTAQEQHQQAKRLEYLKLFDLATDGTDTCFWKAARGLEVKLAEFLDAQGDDAKCADLFELFVTPYPEGLNKCAHKPHPESNTVGYTLVTHATLFTEGTYLRWQRSVDGTSYPAQPETYPF